MQTKKIITLTIMLIIFLMLFFGCAPKSSDLEKKVMELQDEIAKKEEVIKELQKESVKPSEDTIIEETTAVTEEEKESLTEDAKVLLVMDSYINAVESKKFTEQKKYVAKYALDLVNFKEYAERDPSAEIREVKRKPSKVDKIEGNKAEGFMSFTEHHESLITNDKYDLLTEGKVYLEKINGEWKIVDYTRKDRLISEAIYIFRDFYKEFSNVKISIDLVLFSLFDEYVDVRYKIENNNDFEISTSAGSSKILGPDRQQNEAVFSGGGDLYDILPTAISIGDVGYNWTAESAGDFKIYFGDVYNSDNYNDLITELTFDVLLSDAIRY